MCVRAFVLRACAGGDVRTFLLHAVAVALESKPERKYNGIYYFLNYGKLSDTPKISSTNRLVRRSSSRRFRPTRSRTRRIGRGGYTKYAKNIFKKTRKISVHKLDFVANIQGKMMRVSVSSYSVYGSPWRC